MNCFMSVTQFLAGSQSVGLCAGSGMAAHQWIGGTIIAIRLFVERILHISY
jgi:hypothetical protein